MLQTVEAIVDKKGHVRLLEKLQFTRPRHALLTILDDKVGTNPKMDTNTLLSEKVLAKDWLRAEEDKAWQSLQ